jgi:hypothetical protein
VIARRAGRTAADRPRLEYLTPRRPHRAVRGALLATAIGGLVWLALALAWWIGGLL